jgi:osmotically-inducible protein OsmY
MPRNDLLIRQDLEARLAEDPRVPDDAVMPEVRCGLVVLRGRLPSERAVQAALIDAWSVGDVAGVDNQLSVSGGGGEAQHPAG